MPHWLFHWCHSLHRIDHKLAKKKGKSVRLRSKCKKKKDRRWLFFSILLSALLFHLIEIYTAVCGKKGGKRKV